MKRSRRSYDRRTAQPFRSAADRDSEVSRRASDGPGCPRAGSVLLPPIEGTAETAAVVVGKPVPGSVGAGDAGLQSSSTWHGSHLTLGKRP